MKIVKYCSQTPTVAVCVVMAPQGTIPKPFQDQHWCCKHIPGRPQMLPQQPLPFARTCPGPCAAGQHIQKPSFLRGLKQCVESCISYAGLTLCCHCQRWEVLPLALVQPELWPQFLCVTSSCFFLLRPEFPVLAPVFHRDSLKYSHILCVGAG